jgi:exopolyphosphatase/guanosine-5'-triphosphate,3'-diphosphate pyrophosphatase
MIFSAIDIGTNTILMLVADVKRDGSFTVLRDEQSIARLGENLSVSGVISDAGIGRAIEILDKYKAINSAFGVNRICVVATAAMRSAKNRDSVAEALSKSIGAEIQIIPGEEEARLSFIGAVNDNDKSYVLDIGGGSTEMILGSNSEIIDKFSFPIGAVKLTETILKQSPPKAEQIKDAIKKVDSIFSSKSIPKEQRKLYAVAGTATTLAQAAQKLNFFNPALIDGYNLTVKEINELIWSFSNLTSIEIAEIYNIPRMRADVILAGSLILYCALKYLNLNSCEVSIKGLRYGVLKKMIADEFDEEL